MKTRKRRASTWTVFAKKECEPGKGDGGSKGGNPQPQRGEELLVRGETAQRKNAGGGGICLHCRDRPDERPDHHRQPLVFIGRESLQYSRRRFEEGGVEDPEKEKRVGITRVKQLLRYADIWIISENPSHVRKGGSSHLQKTKEKAISSSWNQGGTATLSLKSTVFSITKVPNSISPEREHARPGGERDNLIDTQNQQDWYQR